MWCKFGRFDVALQSLTDGCGEQRLCLLNARRSRERYGTRIVFGANTDERATGRRNDKLRKQ